MVVDEVYKMNNGEKIPKLALGTWQISDEDAEFAVQTAIEAE